MSELTKEETTNLAKNFDHQSKDVMSEPHETYKALRQQCPVAHSEKHGGFWMLSRYQDVFNAGLDYSTYSSKDGTAIPKHAIFPMYPIDLDPPEQVLFRKALNPKFEGKYVTSLEISIRETTNALIDNIIEKGECDLANDLCRELPPIIALKLLGVPDKDSDAMRSHIHTMTHNRNDAEAAMQAGQQLAGYLLGLVAQRRASEAQDDIIGVLLNTELHGEKLTDDQIFRTLTIILFGGLDTSTAVMIQSLLLLARNPEDKQRLIDNPDLWNSAVEEFVRYTSPVQGLKRQIAKDTELHGETLKEGDNAFILWASANRDESVFPEPDKCILDRKPNKHLGFGAGAHKCIGIHFGRSMVKILLQTVLERMPDYQIADDFKPEYEVGEARGIVYLPATFTPGKKLSA